MEYVVQVFPNRMVDLQQGRFGFRDPKHFTGEMSPDFYNNLITAFRQAKFFSMRDLYFEQMTDANGIIITFTFDGQRKRVAQFNGVLVGAPDSLFKLADQIDQLTDIKRWNDVR